LFSVKFNFIKIYLKTETFVVYYTIKICRGKGICGGKIILIYKKGRECYNYNISNERNSKRTV